MENNLSLYPLLTDTNHFQTFKSVIQQQHKRTQNTSIKKSINHRGRT